MKLRYAVTLEFLEDAPLTARGDLEVSNPRLGARRAVEGAFAQYPGRRWNTLSVLLERVEGGGDEDGR